MALLVLKAGEFIRLAGGTKVHLESVVDGRAHLSIANENGSEPEVTRSGASGVTQSRPEDTRH